MSLECLFEPIQKWLSSLWVYLANPSDCASQPVNELVFVVKICVVYLGLESAYSAIVYDGAQFLVPFFSEVRVTVEGHSQKMPPALPSRRYSGFSGVDVVA